MFDEDEEWRDIVGYPNYQVSNFGRVWSLKTNQFLKPNTDRDGYQQVALWIHNRPSTKKVHRLVTEAFLPRRVNANQVNHDDGDKSYNDLRNLAWVTRSENTKHMYSIGLHPNIKAVRCLNTGEVFSSMAEASRKTGINIAYISLNARGLNKPRNGSLQFELIEETR